MTENTPTPAAPSTPAPTAPTPAAPRTASLPRDLGPQAELTESQAAKMSEWIKQDLAAGKLSPDKAEQMFNELGRTPEQRLPDQRTDEQKMFDKQFGPPAKPEDYRITYGGPGEDVVMTPELKQADARVRGWLVALGVSREIGQAMINRISKLAQQKMTPEQVEVYADTENAKLRGVYKDTWDQRFEPTNRMIQAVEATNPGLNDFLRAHGVGDDSGLVALLNDHAPVYWAKDHARKGR